MCVSVKVFLLLLFHYHCFENYLIVLIDDTEKFCEKLLRVSTVAYCGEYTVII